MDKNEGPVATILVQNGTLNVGENVFVGTITGKIRSMKNYKNEAIESAGPSTPVRILGLKGVPSAGDIWQVERDEAVVKNVLRNSGPCPCPPFGSSNIAITADNLFSFGLKQLTILKPGANWGACISIKRL